MSIRLAALHRRWTRIASITLIGAVIVSACGVEQGVETIGAAPTPADRVPA